jgi:hypothetical protein
MTVGASPYKNLLRNNDAHGPRGLGRRHTSRQQLDVRDKNDCRFKGDRETGLTRDCRHGHHVIWMSNFPPANAFLAVPTLLINRDHGVRRKHETLAMIAKSKILTSNAIATMNTGLWANSCNSGNLLTKCFDKLLLVGEEPSLRRRGKPWRTSVWPLGLGPKKPMHGIKRGTMNGLSGHPGQATVLWWMRHLHRRHKTLTLIQAPTTKTAMTLVMMVIVFNLTRLRIVIRARGADWCWANGKLSMVRLGMISTTANSSESQRQQRRKSSSMERFVRWQIAQVWCAAGGFAQLTAEASDVSIRTVVTRVLSVQPPSV